MSHHFDTQRAKSDPSMNICDMYLFEGAPGHTVMAMTTNADAGISAPDSLPSEALYAFRFDLDEDGREDVVFKFKFGQPRHGDAAEHVHVQAFEVLRATGQDIGGHGGEVLIAGETGRTHSNGAVQAFVGVAPELWAADAVAFFDFLTGLYSKDRFAAEAFEHRKNFFRNRNVMALVLEVPNSLIGGGTVHGWATASLYGHAPEVQICRWGLPLFTHLYLSDPKNPTLVETFHATSPWQDVIHFADAVATFAGHLSERAGSSADPAEHGRRVAALVCPVMLPYELGTRATFNQYRFNGRPLDIDAYDVMLTLGANKAIADGVSPDRERIINSFPYYGAPYNKAEQAGLEPISTGFYDQ